MDSHLSNAQRCARKADTLVKYGMYEEAFTQLDKSISLLSELKTLTTRYENIQMLNVQIDSIDRKKRSVAIKRSESIKKKYQVATVKKQQQPHVRVQHIPIPALRQQAQTINKCDQSPVIIEYCYNSDQVTFVRAEHKNEHKNEHKTESMFVQGRKKLDKDDQLKIEELATTNAAYKKVNSLLAGEIEQLKRENDLLKMRLVKVHMSDIKDRSYTDSLMEHNLEHSLEHSLDSSTPKQSSIHQAVPSLSVTSNSSGHSSTSSSYSANSSGGQTKAVDLSKYIDGEEDEEYEPDLSSHYEFDEDSNDVSSHPPFEFTIDSVY